MVVRFLFSLTLQLLNLLLIPRLRLLQLVLALMQLLLLSEVRILELKFPLLGTGDFLLEPALNCGQLLQVHQHVLVVFGDLLQLELEVQFDSLVLLGFLGSFLSQFLHQRVELADLALVALLQPGAFLAPFGLQLVFAAVELLAQRVF